jgi:hypothetical protein
MVFSLIGFFEVVIDSSNQAFRGIYICWNNAIDNIIHSFRIKPILSPSKNVLFDNIRSWISIFWNSGI